MKKKIWIIISLILLLGAGFFVYQRIHRKAASPTNNLQALKDSIIHDPKVNAPNLSTADRQKYLADFSAAKKQVLDTNFDFLQAINGVGLAKEHLGDIQGAIAAWQYANAIRPKNSLSFANLAALYQYDLKQYDKAEENYLIAIENGPTDVFTIRNLYELYYYTLKDNAKTENLLLQSIGNNPKIADFDTLLAEFYQDQGKTDQAISYYKKSLGIDPSNKNVQKALADLQSQATKK